MFEIDRKHAAAESADGTVMPDHPVTGNKHRIGITGHGRAHEPGGPGIESITVRGAVYTGVLQDTIQAIAMLTLENISGSHKLKWEWVDPNGAVYLATEDYSVSVDEGKYLPTVAA